MAAVEVMVATSAVRALIRDGKTHQLLSAIQTGQKYGMQGLEQAFMRLLNEGKVERAVAQHHLQAIVGFREDAGAGGAKPSGGTARITSMEEVPKRDRRSSKYQYT